MRIIVVGAGGHAKVVVDAAQSAGYSVVGVVDEHEGATPLGGIDLVSDPSAVEFDGFVIAIGDNAVRKERFDHYQALGYAPATVFHEDAVVAESATIGAGTVVFAGVVVNPDALIGQNAILNTGCTIDHDCRVGDHAHIGPGVSLCGAVSIGEGALLGVGSCAAPASQVGEWSTVGAGATVIGSISARSVCVGTPARELPREGGAA